MPPMIWIFAGFSGRSRSVAMTTRGGPGIVLASLAYSVFNPVSKLEPYPIALRGVSQMYRKNFSSAFSWLDALSQHAP